MNSQLLIRLFAVLRTAMFALIFMGTVGIYLPRYLGLLNGPIHLHDWRLLGIAILITGAFIALRCAFAFAWMGHGTPAPFDPPHRLVVSGMYRYVRNPMYFGMALFLIGEWLLWGSNLRGALIYTAVFATVVFLFVILYEEPTLRRKFPDNYAEYLRHVPRFIPQLRPWTPSQIKNAASNRS